MGSLGILIPILIFSIPVLAIWTKHQQRMAEMGAMPAQSIDTGALAAQAEKIRALEERVRVLERIVTDESTDLASQIEALRHDTTGAGVPLGLGKEHV